MYKDNNTSASDYVLWFQMQSCKYAHNATANVELEVNNIKTSYTTVKSLRGVFITKQTSTLGHSN